MTDLIYFAEKFPQSKILVVCSNPVEEHFVNRLFREEVFVQPTATLLTCQWGAALTGHGPFDRVYVQPGNILTMVDLNWLRGSVAIKFNRSGGDFHILESVA